jgi:hypothetical protein
MEVFEMTKSFPKEEKYALTSQILTMPATRDGKARTDWPSALWRINEKPESYRGIKPGAI